MTEQYDMDERTIAMHDIWIAMKMLSDAEYRCEVMAKLMGDGQFERHRAVLNGIWQMLDELHGHMGAVHNEETEPDKE